jgi:hypothetical protein
MKIETLAISLIGIIILVGAFLMIKSKPLTVEESINYDERVKSGQVWVKTDSTNPFKPIMIDTIQVIDVKKDYALILIKEDTISVSSKFVTIDSKQIK